MGVEGMTPQQVSNKIANDKKRDAPRHQPAFPAAVEDDSVEELPPLRLDYDTWTSMLQPHHDASEPSQLARRARARRRGWCAGQLALQPFGSSPLLHVQHMHLDMTCAAHAPHAYSTRPARRSYLPSTIKPLHLKPREDARRCGMGCVFVLWRGVGEPALRDLYNALASSKKK